MRERLFRRPTYVWILAVPFVILLVALANAWAIQIPQHTHEPLAVNLSAVSDAVSVSVQSDLGNDGVIGAASDTAAGVMTAAQHAALHTHTEGQVWPSASTWG